MPKIADGTPLTAKLFFNTGYIDLGGSPISHRLVNLDNVSIEVSFAEKELRRLNSIKLAAIKRATFKVALRGKVKSINKEVYEAMMGEGANDNNDYMVSVKDGQAPTLNPTFTGYIDDDTDKAVQFQFTDAIILSMPTSATLEEYGECDFEMTARDVKVFIAGEGTL